MNKLFNHTVASKENHYQIQSVPYDTDSLCPECLHIIGGRIYREDGRIFMSKNCPEHGDWKELISADADFYELMLTRDKGAKRSVANPLRNQADCPFGCGICEKHASSPMMINIDLTNRCNLNCPICFANANARGAVVEWKIKQVGEMLDKVCETHDVPPVCLQFTGGEPTVHPRFLAALEEGKKRGFPQIQAATNGLKFARSKEFCQQAGEAGLNVVYLQFDSLDDEIYKKIRGRPLREIKQAAIDNLHASGIRSVLVPTMVKGVNDKEIGPIIRFTLDNIEKITAISWQPVSFTGRIDYAKRMAQRFTMADLAREIQEQTGVMDMYRDWYPFSYGDPFARLAENLNGKEGTRLTCNAGCGAIGYLIVDLITRKPVSIPEFVNVEPLMKELEEMAEKAEDSGRLKKFALSRQLKKLDKYFHPEKAPAGWTFGDLADFMMNFIDFSERYPDNRSRQESFNGKPYRALMMASMHFQDTYNYQLERVKKCVVHYAAPNGRIYPFCTYNCGPYHRRGVDKQYAVPVSQKDTDGN